MRHAALERLVGTRTGKALPDTHPLVAEALANELVARDAEGFLVLTDVGADLIESEKRNRREEVAARKQQRIDARAERVERRDAAAAERLEQKAEREQRKKDRGGKKPKSLK